MNNSTAYAIPGVEKKISTYRLSTLTEISETVCDKYNVTMAQLVVRTRKRKVVLPRQIGMALSKVKTKHTLDSIGFYWGGFDHATVLHSVKTVKNLLDTDRVFREETDGLFVGVNWPHFKNQLK